MDTKKVVAPKLFMCTNATCDFSTGKVGVDKDGKPRLIEVTTRKGNKKVDLQSPPYGVVSAKEGETAVCPVCGAVLTTEEDGRHKFLRLNSQRIAAVREKMRLIGNTMKGAQYDPSADDLKKVQSILYAEVDTLMGLIDRRAEKIANGGNTPRQHKVGAKNVKIPFAL